MRFVNSVIDDFKSKEHDPFSDLNENLLSHSVTKT